MPCMHDISRPACTALVGLVSGNKPPHSSVEWTKQHVPASQTGAQPVALASLLQLSACLHSVLDEGEYLVVKLVAQHVAQEALGIAGEISPGCLSRGLQVSA